MKFDFKGEYKGAKVKSEISGDLGQSFRDWLNRPNKEQIRQEEYRKNKEQDHRQKMQFGMIMVGCMFLGVILTVLCLLIVHHFIH